jgi:FlgD Ig-like domain
VAGSATLLFGSRYTSDASSFPESAGTAVFYDSTRVSVTRSAGDAFWISGSPDSLTDWICDDRLYVESTNSGSVGFSAIIDGDLPLCRPIEEVLAPVSAREVTSLIPDATNCVTFRLADTERQIFGNSAIYLVKTSLVGVSDEVAPAALAMSPPHPNPSTGAITLSITLPNADRLTVDILDLQGRVVRRIMSGESFGAGVRSISWDGRMVSGKSLAAGMYVVRATTRTLSVTRGLVVLK